MTWKEWQDNIQKHTESFLTKRKQKRFKKLEAHKRKNPFMEWTIIIIQVIVIVIIINLFLFQNYRIPSESMVPELQIGDLIFVEKWSFGAEILPGKIKLPAWRMPLRGEVVSFESKDYAEQGPWIEFWQRFIYMITLTTVNLKVDKYNQPIKDLLIKRVIGLPGERIRIIHNDLAEILAPGETNWVSERAFQQEINHNYTNQAVENQLGQEFPITVLEDLNPEGLEIEGYSYTYYNAMQEYKKAPYDSEKQEQWLIQDLGFYIPENRFFPMGDNRNRSKDAREYGPVLLKKIQGKALFRWLPLSRIGAIR
jgi:signal peptidase I